MLITVRMACAWCHSCGDEAPIEALAPAGYPDWDSGEPRQVCSLRCKLEMESFTDEGATRLLAYHTPGAVLC